MLRKFRPASIPCLQAGCDKLFKTLGGRKRHEGSAHHSRLDGAIPADPAAVPPIPVRADSPALPELELDVGAAELLPALAEQDLAPAPDAAVGDNPPHAGAGGDADATTVETHPIITGKSLAYCRGHLADCVALGRPCNIQGEPLPPNAPPPPPPLRGPKDYSPYHSRPQFEIADFLFRKEQMSAGNVGELMQLWAATLPPGEDPPFADAKDMYQSIDSIPLADIPWQAFKVTYAGPRPDGEVPPWMLREYTVWYRCPRHVLHTQLGNPDFAGEMDFSPKQVFHGDKREYKDFMSGDWAWTQAASYVLAAAEHKTHRICCRTSSQGTRVT